MTNLELSILVNGVNGPKLQVSGETKEEAVNSLRRFAMAQEGATVALAFQIKEGDTIMLRPSRQTTWALVWARCAPP